MFPQNVLKNKNENENQYKTKKAPPFGEGPNYKLLLQMLTQGHIRMHFFYPYNHLTPLPRVNMFSNIAC